MQVSVANLRHAFHVRLAEWQAATILTMWGVSLVIPGAKVFDGPGEAYFVALRMIVSQHWMGTLCLLGGLIRLAVLAANGGWGPMYYVRAWMALSSSVVWLILTLGFLAAGVPGPWMAVYPVLFVFDAINVFRAVTDAAIYEKGRVKGMHENGGH